LKCSDQSVSYVRGLGKNAVGRPYAANQMWGMAPCELENPLLSIFFATSFLVICFSSTNFQSFTIFFLFLKMAWVLNARCANSFINLVSNLAIYTGIFILIGKNWAREWLNDDGSLQLSYKC